METEQPIKVINIHLEYAWGGCAPKGVHAQ